MNSPFEKLGVGRWLIDQLSELNLKKPTPVQIECIPKILEGSDVLGCSKTGTGKTLAFALPILEKLSEEPFGIYALIITPTRELAFQINDQFSALGKKINLKSSVIVGGRYQVIQAQELTKRPHIVVATPGRLADHIESDPNGIAKLFQTIRFLVLDEADRLLDGQYALQLQNIFKTIPKQRQTLLFSATITSALNQLHQVSIRKPFFFEDQSDIKTVDRLEQRYVLCPNGVKDAYLVHVVKNFYLKRETASILIFAQTCRECEALALMFKALGFEVGSLHSQIMQNQRMASLTRFRSGKIRILICTDVASRGLDIPHVELVINHNVPRCPKTYIHRVGRSARAGRFGGAITFVTQYDLLLVGEVEKVIGKKLEPLEVSDKQVTLYVARVLATKREAEIKMDRESFGERKEIYKRKEMKLAGLEDEEVEKAIKEMNNRKKKSSNGTMKQKIAKKRIGKKSPKKKNSSTEKKMAMEN